MLATRAVRISSRTLRTGVSVVLIGNVQAPLWATAWASKHPHLPLLLQQHVQELVVCLETYLTGSHKIPDATCLAICYRSVLEMTSEVAAPRGVSLRDALDRAIGFLCRQVHDSFRRPQQLSIAQHPLEALQAYGEGP